MTSAEERAPRALGRAAVRELDRRAIEEVGMPSFALMENAGRASADVARELLSEGRAGAPVVVLIGPGNNGGDGLVVARTLVNRGVPARVFFPGELARLELCSADVRKNVELWTRSGGRIEPLGPPFAECLAQAPLVVDGLFGTGLDRPLRAPYDEIVGSVNDAGRRVLALDLPSGLDADEGHVLGAAVRAEVTVTFVAPKLGFTRGAGPEYCGRVIVAEIGIPRFLLEE